MKIRKTHLMTKSVYVLTLKKEKILESHASVTADACFFVNYYLLYELKLPSCATQATRTFCFDFFFVVYNQIFSKNALSNFVSNMNLVIFISWIEKFNKYVSFIIRIVIIIRYVILKALYLLVLHLHYQIIRAVQTISSHSICVGHSCWFHHCSSGIPLVVEPSIYP